MMKKYYRCSAVLTVLLTALSSWAAREQTASRELEPASPDPLFDQAGFDFDTYTASYDQTSRPQFHFTSREGYINDPNGLIYYDGEWHLYFQHKGQKVWGHAVSTDLVHWKQLQHAIVMHKGHCPSDGQIWSGTAVIDRDNILGKQKGETKTIVAFFTHTQPAGFHQDGAYSTDRGRTFRLMGNLVPNQGISKGERDPKVVWDPETKKWIMPVIAATALFVVLLMTPMIHPAHAEFKPTRESLSEYKVPEWYQDAKIGFFYHWGPHSVIGNHFNEDVMLFCRQQGKYAGTAERNPPGQWAQTMYPKPGQHGEDRVHRGAGLRRKGRMETDRQRD